MKSGAKVGNDVGLNVAIGFKDVGLVIGCDHDINGAVSSSASVDVCVGQDVAFGAGFVIRTVGVGVNGVVARFGVGNGEVGIRLGAVGGGVGEVGEGVGVEFGSGIVVENCIGGIRAVGLGVDVGVCVGNNGIRFCVGFGVVGVGVGGGGGLGLGLDVGGVGYGIVIDVGVGTGVCIAVIPVAGKLPREDWPSSTSSSRDSNRACLK